MKVKQEVGKILSPVSGVHSPDYKNGSGGSAKQCKEVRHEQACGGIGDESKQNEEELVC